MPSRQVKQISTAGMREIDSPTNEELDNANLARMGKRPVLKVTILTVPNIIGVKC